jgi:diacylglycerol kinase (ATP)
MGEGAAMKSGHGGIYRIWRAWVNSIEGLVCAWRDEAAVRQEVALCVVGAVLIFVLDIHWMQRLLLASTLFFILFAEFVNTSIEALTDRVSDEIHPLSKKAKDVASLAVLVALIWAALVWAVVLWQYFLA